MPPIYLEEPGLADPALVDLINEAQSSAFLEAFADATAAGGVGLLPGVGIVLAGAKLDQVLLSNQHWDNAWIAVGGKLDDAWNSVYKFLNPPKSPSSAQVKQLIEQRAAITAEHIRQVSTGHTIIEAMLATVVHNEHVARIGSENAAGSRIRAAAIQAQQQANVATITAVAHANALDTQRGKITQLEIVNQSKADRTWTTTTVAKPLGEQIIKTQAQVDTIEKTLPKLVEAAVATAVAAKLAPIAKALTAAQSQLSKLMTEAETCVEPMCDVMGPKTDLGKFLKGLNIAKWLAIFAALETIDVKELEQIALAVAGTEGRIGDFVASHVLDELESEHP